jgi:UDP-N-acetyl-D-mannosaminuronic acid transferase (WecB/TagA/CpsF family)
MSARGTRGDVAKNKAQVMAFLNMAVIGNADDDEEMRDYYQNLRVSLKDGPTVGYPVYQNDTPQYALQNGGREVHQMLASLADIEIRSMG